MGGSDAAYITECGVACVDGIGTEGGIFTPQKNTQRQNP